MQNKILLLTFSLFFNLNSEKNNCCKPIAAQIINPCEISTFLAATYDDTAQNNPDTMGAVGPKQYVIAIKGRVRSFSKATLSYDGVLNITLDRFFDTVRNSLWLSDPRIRFDKYANNWVILGLQGIFLANSFYLAISDGPILTNQSKWSFYEVPITQVTPEMPTNLVDQPTLGLDKNAIYVGATITSRFDNVFLSSATVIKKPEVFGGPINVNTFLSPNFFPGNTQTVFDFQPADNIDNSFDSNFGFFVDVAFEEISPFSAGSATNSITIVRVNNPGSSSPTFTQLPDLAIPLVTQALPDPHKDGLLPLVPNGLSLRILSAHIRNKTIWACHDIAVDQNGNSDTPSVDRTAIRWYQIDVSNPDLPVLIHYGTLYDKTVTATPRSFYQGSLMTTNKGDLLVGASTSSAINFIDGMFSIIPAASFLQPQLEIEFPNPPCIYTNATQSYNPPLDISAEAGAGLGYRWGDYSNSSIDFDGSTIWTIQEFTAAKDIWGVQVAKVPTQARAPFKVSALRQALFNKLCN